jgi:hypothetical protein
VPEHALDVLHCPLLLRQCRNRAPDHLEGQLGQLKFLRQSVQNPIPVVVAVTFTDCKGALRAIALGVCDYLTESTGCPTQLARIPLEGSIIPVVEDMFKEGLALHGMAPGVEAALRATTAAWAVFGAARRWFQSPNRIPAEEMAAWIEAMVSPVLFGAS